MKPLRIAMVGLGNVGCGFARVLRKAQESDVDVWRRDIRVVGVATASRGVHYWEEGVDLEVLGATGRRDALPEDGVRIELMELVRHARVDVIVETTPTNLDTGQPATDILTAALDAGKHVLTANKGPIGLYYVALAARASRKGLVLGIEATVMSGTPVLGLIETLRPAEIIEIRGILNGTTNYMLTQMERGEAYKDALIRAQELGYAEPDPTADVEGIDAQAKVMTLSQAAFGQALDRRSVPVEGITRLTPEKLRQARTRGEVIKLIGTVTPERADVALVALPEDDSLASVNGSMNAMAIKTHVMGTVTLVGAGAGPEETGFGLLSDLKRVCEVERGEPNPTY